MIVLIAGCPRSGKSTLARKLLTQAIAKDGNPAVVFDPEHAHNFVDLPHPEKLEEVFRHVYVFGRHVAYSNVPDFENLLKGLKAGGDVSLLVDEAKELADAHKMSAALQDLLRARQHARITSLILTTQRLAWLHQDLRALAERVILFRLTSPADQRAAAQDWGINADRLATLPKYEYITHDVGFVDDDEEVPRPAFNRDAETDHGSVGPAGALNQDAPLGARAVSPSHGDAGDGEEVSGATG